MRLKSISLMINGLYNDTKRGGNMEKLIRSNIADIDLLKPLKRECPFNKTTFSIHRTLWNVKCYVYIYSFTNLQIYLYDFNKVLFKIRKFH